MESALSSKGQITIPKEARERLKIGPGDRVKFFFDDRGRLTMMPKVPTASLAGSVRSRLGRPATLDEIRNGYVAGAVKRHKA